MRKLAGVFCVDDSLNITGRGLVLLGRLSGQVAPGYQLLFEDATCWTIKSVEFANLGNKQEKIALLVNAPPTITREELLKRGSMWNTVQILES